jgi:hypothetical protein
METGTQHRQVTLHGAVQEVSQLLVSAVQGLLTYPYRRYKDKQEADFRRAVFNAYNDGRQLGAVQGYDQGYQEGAAYGYRLAIIEMNKRPPETDRFSDN